MLVVIVGIVNPQYMILYSSQRYEGQRPVTKIGMGAGALEDFLPLVINLAMRMVVWYRWDTP